MLAAAWVSEEQTQPLLVSVFLEGKMDKNMASLKGRPSPKWRRSSPRSEAAFKAGSRAGLIAVIVIIIVTVTEKAIIKGIVIAHLPLERSHRRAPPNRGSQESFEDEARQHQRPIFSDKGQKDCAG